MKNTVVLEVKGKKLTFWPFEQNAGNTTVNLSWWPKALTAKLSKPGIYGIERVDKRGRNVVTAEIRGCAPGIAYHPAKWEQGATCMICQRLLKHWGITIPEYVTRTFHFKVTRL